MDCVRCPLVGVSQPGATPIATCAVSRRLVSDTLTCERLRPAARMPRAGGALPGARRGPSTSTMSRKLHALLSSAETGRQADRESPAVRRTGARCPEIGGQPAAVARRVVELLDLEQVDSSSGNTAARSHAPSRLGQVARWSNAHSFGGGYPVGGWYFAITCVARGCFVRAILDHARARAGPPGHDHSSSTLSVAITTTGSSSFEQLLRRRVGSRYTRFLLELEPTQQQQELRRARCRCSTPHNRWSSQPRHQARRRLSNNFSIRLRRAQRPRSSRSRSATR